MSDLFEKTMPFVIANDEEFQCPHPGSECDWMGTHDLMPTHIILTHTDNFAIGDGLREAHLKIDENRRGLCAKMFTRFGCYFLAVGWKISTVDSTSTQLGLIVQFFGSQRASNRYVYKFEFFKDGNWMVAGEAFTATVERNWFDVAQKGDCLIFDANIFPVPTQFRLNMEELPMICSTLELERYCQFEEIHACPLPGPHCNWKGPLEQMVEHLNNCHFENGVAVDDHGTYQIAPEKNLFGIGAVLFPLFGYHFLTVSCRVQLSDDTCDFKTLVQFIGPPSEASRYVFRVDCIDEEYTLRDEAYTQSIQEHCLQMFEENQCVIFNSRYCSLYPDFHITVLRCDDINA